MCGLCIIVYEVFEYLVFEMIEVEIFEDFLDLIKEDLKVCIVYVVDCEC